MSEENKESLLSEEEKIEQLVAASRALGYGPDFEAELRRMSLLRTGIRRNYKEALFTSLFSYRRFVLELYKVLNPSDKTVTLEDIHIITLENTITNGAHNGLGFSVRDRLFVLAEAQSTMTENIVFRLLCYLVDTWRDYLKTKQSVSTSPSLQLPKPALYAVFPNMSGPESFNLADIFFAGDRSALDCAVKCVYTAGRDNILGQYIRCAEICGEEAGKWGRDFSMAAAEARRRCLEENVLTEYMEDFGGDLVNILRYRTEAEENELVMLQERKEGRKEEKSDIARRMISKKVEPETIADFCNMSIEDARKLAADPAYRL